MGNGFLNNYGNYNSIETENTKAFEDFKGFNADASELKRQLENIKNSKDYKLGQSLFFPLRLIKRLIF